MIRLLTTKTGFAGTGPIVNVIPWTTPQSKSYLATGTGGAIDSNY